MMMTRPLLRQPSALASIGLWLIGAVALAYLSLQILSAWRGGLFVEAARAIPGQTIALAALVYMTGHLFRSMRLALLIGGWNVGLRLIASFHFVTAGVSLAMPLKLGEFFRIAALSRVAGSITRAIEIVWWERLLDVVALIIIMMIALRDVTGSQWQDFSGIVAVSIAFVAVSVLAFFVLPDNLRRTSVLIIRRYRSCPESTGTRAMRHYRSPAHGADQDGVAGCFDRADLDLRNRHFRDYPARDGPGHGKRARCAVEASVFPGARADPCGRSAESPSS